MAAVVFNVAKGRVVELFSRVVALDPANSALVIIPLEAAGLESNADLIDRADVDAVLSGATNEQTAMGRKTLTGVDLGSLPAPDNTNDRRELSLPSVTWSATAGNPIAKLLVAYQPDSTGGTDADLVPLTLMDAVMTPDGTDLVVSAGLFFRAS